VRSKRAGQAKKPDIDKRADMPKTPRHGKRAAPREEPVTPQRPDYHPQRPHETPPL